MTPIGVDRPPSPTEGRSRHARRERPELGDAEDHGGDECRSRGRPHTRRHAGAAANDEGEEQDRRNTLEHDGDDVASQRTSRGICQRGQIPQVRPPRTIGRQPVREDESASHADDHIGEDTPSERARPARRHTARRPARHGDGNGGDGNRGQQPLGPRAGRYRRVAAVDRRGEREAGDGETQPGPVGGQPPREPWPRDDERDTAEHGKDPHGGLADSPRGERDAVAEVSAHGICRKRRQRARRESPRPRRPQRAAEVEVRSAPPQSA